jgi:hypothetical protein
MYIVENFTLYAIMIASVVTHNDVLDIIPVYMLQTHNLRVLCMYNTYAGLQLA